MEMAKLIRDGKVLLVKAQAIDKKELEKDRSKVIWTVFQSSTKDLPSQYIAITPACVGTIHKLQGATIRGRVVVDLSHLSSTQAIYTAVTRVTTSELLKLTPQTDFIQWKQLRFPNQVYDEHLFLMHISVNTL